MSEQDYEIYTGKDPDTGQEFLVRVYRDSHGITRTISTREFGASTWGPEHLLLAERVPA